LNPAVYLDLHVPNLFIVFNFLPFYTSALPLLPRISRHPPIPS
jgi:hypothetical protein